MVEVSAISGTMGAYILVRFLLSNHKWLGEFSPKFAAAHN